MHEVTDPPRPYRPLHQVNSAEKDLPACSAPSSLPLGWFSPLARSALPMRRAAAPGRPGRTRPPPRPRRRAHPRPAGRAGTRRTASAAIVARPARHAGIAARNMPRRRTRAAAPRAARRPASRTDPRHQHALKKGGREAPFVVPAPATRPVHPGQGQRHPDPDAAARNDDGARRPERNRPLRHGEEDCRHPRPSRGFDRIGFNACVADRTDGPQD